MPNTDNHREASQDYTNQQPLSSQAVYVSGLLTKSLGVEHLSQVVRGEGVHSQNALIRETPLTAGNEYS